MNKDQVIQTLRDLGMGKGEAKTYTALALGGAQEATPLAKLAGVPQPKIYDYLKNLIDEGFVSVYESGGRARIYEATSPDLVIARLSDRISEKSKMISSYFKNIRIEDSKYNEAMIDVRVGSETVKLRVEDIFSKAKKNILIVFLSKIYHPFLSELMKKYHWLVYYKLNGFDRLVAKILEHAQNLNFNHLDRLKTLQPAVLMTDIDFENRTCDRSIILGPPSDIEDAFLGVFRHSFIPRYQINLILTMTDLMDDLKIEKINAKEIGE